MFYVQKCCKMQPVRKEIKNFLQEDTHMIRIGISGFGRIGRLAARVALRRGDMEVVAINAPDKTPEQIAYFLIDADMKAHLESCVCRN